MIDLRKLCFSAKIVSILTLSLSPLRLSADYFTQNNLVSDVPGMAATTDPNLKNPWGVAFAPSSPFWVSNQASGTATLYDGAGNIVPLVVTVPGGGVPSGPTGQVFNGTTDFAVGGKASHFIFDTLNGTIAAWTGGTSATTQVTTPGAIYTGLALANSGGSNYLYAADSAPGGQIRVFDSSFHSVSLAGNFTDPNAQPGFVPFNVQLVGSSLYVTFAQLTGMGTGLPGGYVDVFNTDGTFSKRLATGGALYAPWGVTLAPASFGLFGDDLLIGNFGNGEINAYDPATGNWLGTFDGSNGKPLVNPFLWSLDFRTGGPNVDTNALYFTAGINNQKDGLFGDITSTPEPATLLLGACGLLSLGLLRRRQKRT